MTQPFVVVTGPVPGTPQIAGAEVRVVDAIKPSPEELRRLVRGAAAIISMYYHKMDAALFDAAGPQLKGVVNYAVGFDNIDLAEAKRRGIVVCNTPHAVTEGTADLAWALLLAVARRLVEADRFARTPEYAARGPLGITEFLGMDLTGKNLLIVGAGRIGYAVAVRSMGWGMRVGYVARQRHLDFELAPLAAQRMSMDDGFRWADVVSVHTPLTPETRHLIDGRALGMMKPTAILINTSRGPVVDEAALAEALEQRKIYGAGLDVYEFEPKVHAGLVGSVHCTLTPHIGSAETKYRLLMTEMTCGNVGAILGGKEPPNRIA